MRTASLNAPKAAARAAGLRYTSDEHVAGIRRLGRPGRFRYIAPSGKPMQNRTTLKWIAKLAIPPAWRDVWIAPHDNAHLLATGRDARGRKQYRYHPGFAAVRDVAKYEHLVKFADSLPNIRRRLKADLRRCGLPREKILASIVTLLEESLIRVGNEDYARDNHSYGLTTLHNRHVAVKGEEIRFLFTGKSGKRWNLSVRDRRVARVLRACQELPGQHLFEYRDVEGVIHPITSADVNAYLREIAGADISAKNFRTWAGTVLAAQAFARAPDMQPTAKAMRAIIAEVAGRLGNTVAVCRKCYIHPAVIEAAENGGIALPTNKARGGLSGRERAVLAFLKRARR